MAVYKRSYHGYDGPVTPEWSRFAIIPRYAYRDLFHSRLMTAFFVACFIAPLVFLALIYVSHNFAHWAELLGARGARSPFAIDGEFFLRYLSFQGALAFILTAFVGPGLVSRDLSNRALPLYLCRPFSRTEYVVGKMSVLLILLSLITWVPGLVLFIIQASLAGGTWLVQNLWIAWALFAGAWIWILMIALLALAISAWIKWRIAAGALLLAVFFVAAGLGAAVNAILEVNWGNLINLSHLINTIWGQLFRVREGDVSTADAWMILSLLAFGCLALLNRKVRGFEVVK
jgi:ABC-2 type transport system permease protein